MMCLLEPSEIIEPNKPAPQFPTVPGGEPSVPSGDAGGAKSGGVSASSVERADAMSGIIVTQSPQAATSHKPAGTPAADNRDKDRAIPVGGPTNSDKQGSPIGERRGSLPSSAGSNPAPATNSQSEASSPAGASAPLAARGADKSAATNSPVAAPAPSMGAATALEGRMSSPASPAIVSSSGPVHFADREHLTVPDDVDLDIPSNLDRRGESRRDA